MVGFSIGGHGRANIDWAHCRAMPSPAAKEKEAKTEAPRRASSALADIVCISRQAGALLPKSVQAFRTISEVAEDLGIQKHVLRFWESKFAQLRPMKRGGGRRYYRPEDVELLRGIHHLLRSQAYTIKGVQRILREQGAEFVKGCWPGGTGTSPAHGGAGPEAAESTGAPRKRRGAAQAVPETPVPVAAKVRGTAKPTGPSPSQLSPAAATAVKGVIEQLESARKSLAGTRAVAQAQPRAKAAAKPAAKPATRAAAKRS